MNQNFFNDSNLTEFIGVAPLDTIGLVIASVDPMLRTEMKIDSQYTALGLISSRTGAAGQILAVDEAVKETNTTVLSIGPGLQKDGAVTVILLSLAPKMSRIQNELLNQHWSISNDMPVKSTLMMPGIWSLPILPVPEKQSTKRFLFR